ncbi:three-Cys-motif partner protein TcmP [Fibrella forsythiae]|uniref:Three-Cys-motif partner protein TcmP n=1 Tax=Fibrella forsythiae TaxID=2817061 RepID=A0ABS3JRD6_9BACT|nr:three-Cys-motif partner protein TcmP [Fibrella forsythiae]MBO0952018.1 three-Cys-motif partner protein TcmP [Fibrella forsythiae]
MSNHFGGSWTFQKVRIIEEYAKAYLQIMKEYPYWKLMYFDGFAGTGEFQVKGKMNPSVFDDNTIGLFEGAARTIASIKEPKPFDMCYFVELETQKALLLRASIEKIREGGVYVVEEDCNQKILDLAAFLTGKRGEGGRNYKVLAFIDPFGMNVQWSSIEALRGLGVDMWILAPTGIGANRLLTRNGQIPDSWANKLESFFGVSKDLIYKNLYRETVETDLFGNTTTTLSKNKKALDEISRLYSERLLTVFKHVSNPYEMRNSTNSTMYHLYLASNNTTAVKIANDIVLKYNLKH